MSYQSMSKRGYKSFVAGYLIHFLLFTGITVTIMYRNSTLTGNVPKSNIETLILTCLVVCFHICLKTCLYIFGCGPPLIQKQTPNMKVLQIVKSLGKLIGLIILSVMFFYFIAVTFGAAFFEKTAETFHFALLLTASVVAPVYIHCGLNTEALYRTFILNSPEPGTERIIYYTSVCSIIGAWLGAFPIPLDWDRPWQVWPRSCVAGTIAGHNVGLFLALIHFCQQYIQMQKSKFV